MAARLPSFIFTTPSRTFIHHSRLLRPRGSSQFKLIDLPLRLSSSFSPSSRSGAGPASSTETQQQRQKVKDALAGTDEQNIGPNMDNLPHVSEEAAAMSKAMGEKGPDIEGQGTPVQEIVKDDSKDTSRLPKVLKDSLPKNRGQSRSYSTEAFNSGSSTNGGIGGDNLPGFPNGTIPPISGQDSGMSDLGSNAVQSEAKRVAKPGLKFELPELPLPRHIHLRRRDEPLMEQVTKLLMRSGKLSVAQRIVSLVQTHLRTSPPPRISPRRPLLPGSPPPSHLPLNPALYIELAVDGVAPLLRIRAQKGAAGGGMALLIPVPLTRRQRRRTAIKWIIDAASKKQEVGVGHAEGFAKRLADEITAVIEGRSSVWEKRNGVHKMGVQARINTGSRKRGRR